MSNLAPPLLRLCLFVGLGLLAAFSLPDNGPAYALVWPWYLYAQVLWLLPWAALALHALAGRPWPRFGGTVDLALAAFALLQIAAALTSAFRGVSLAALPIALAPVGFAYALRLLPVGGLPGTPVLLHGAVAVATLLNLAALAWWIVRDVAPALALGATPGNALAIRNLHPLGHWNYTAAAGLLGFALGLPLLVRGAGRVRALGAAGAVTGLAMCASGASRGALLGLGALAGVWLLVEARRRNWTWPRIGLVAAVLAAVLLGAALLHPRTRLIFAQWGTSRTLNTGDRQRWAMLEAGARMVRDHPWLGVGPGAVPRAYPDYRARLSGGVESALQLHCAPAQIAAESGLPALGALLGAVAVLGLRALRRAPHEPAALAAAGTLAAYGTMALTDHQFEIAWFAAAIGACLALAGGDARTPPVSAGAAARAGKLAGGLVLAALAAFAVSQRSPLAARAAFADAIEDLFIKKVAAYEAGVAEARALDPQETFYPNLHGLLLLEPQLYFVPASLGEPAERFVRGRAALEESLARNPAQETAHFNLGWALVERDPAAAEAHFAAAARLVPDKGGVYFGLGLARLAQGRNEAAVAAWAVELANDPAFAAAPSWLDRRLRPLAADVRRAAARELERIAADAPAADPLGYARRARYAAALLRWADGDDRALPAALRDAEPAQRETLRWLAGEKPDPAAAPARLLVLAGALDDADAATTGARLRTFYDTFRPPLPDETAREVTAFVRAADRRKLLLPDAFSPRLLFQIRRERSAYGLLMKNLDGPTVRDLYLVQENRIVHDFLQPLFPEKGYLPGPVLAGLLENSSR